MLCGLLVFLPLARGDKNHTGFHPQILDAYFATFYIRMRLTEFEKKDSYFQNGFSMQKNPAPKNTPLFPLFLLMLSVFQMGASPGWGSF